jgi:dihydrofolate reductase
VAHSGGHGAFQSHDVVISRDPAWSDVGAEHAGTVAEALGMTAPADTWVIGGGEIYRAAMDYATTLMVTEVALDIEGDAHAPLLGAEWTLTVDEPWQQSQPTGVRYRFRSYTR